MNAFDQGQLRAAIRATVEKIRRFQDRSIGEQNTKASLIEPMLEALGWDVRDPDVVHREFKPTSQDKPVDYALCLAREPRLLVEAKALGETLADHKWIAQVLSYTTVAGVVWCVLTDGNEWRFYNATARVPAEEKLFYCLKLTECNESEAVEILSCLAPANLEKNLLDELWHSHFVDRRVRDALLAMTRSPDQGLVRLLRQRVSPLTPSQITQSLHRLTVRVELPTIPAIASKRTPAKPLRKRNRAGRELSQLEKRASLSVDLEDLIAAGVLRPGLRLFRQYKGRLLEATLYPDGKVEFQGKMHDSCSTAADFARSTVTGRRMSTNGWAFWQYEDAEGKARTLDYARQQLVAGNRS